MRKEDILKISDEMNAKSAEEILSWAFEKFNTKVALASSLSIEDMALTHMMIQIKQDAQIFTLDTGRLFQETHDTIDAVRMKYGRGIEILFPERGEVEAMVNEHGVNLFYDSVENRKLCCKIRKVNVLKKKLSTLNAWITGIRRSQSVTRTEIPKVEWDEGNGIVKINPIADWSEEQTWKYIQSNQIPFNRLQKQGYPSIGCLPCTRAIKEGEDVRAGRWWWENPEHKECGLHVK